MKQPVVLLDNGAFSIKMGVTGGPMNMTAKDVRVFPNAIIRSKGDKKTFFGPEFAECQDFAGLHYRLPFEKGYLTDWDAQKAIWDGVLTQEFLGVDPRSSSIIVTEPYFDLPNIQDVYDQFMFEEYEFAAYHRTTPAAMIPYGPLFKVRGLPTPECMLIVDAGFSFTHVVPVINGVIEWAAVKRIDIGGKLLTNHLKELISYRQWNMMDETHVMNDVKEACCYVSQGFSADLETCRKSPKSNPIAREYILPDFSRNKQGRVRQADDVLIELDQIMYMGNERFSVPEVLFRPAYIGLNQAGLAATIAQSIALLPEQLQGMFWANIGLIGGSAKLPGLAQRLAAELRPLAPAGDDVKIYESNDSVTEAYRSAVAFARSARFRDHTVTREEYLERGSNACRSKFLDWKGQSELVKGKGRVRVDESDEELSSSTQTKPQKTRTRTISAVKRR